MLNAAKSLFKIGESVLGYGSNNSVQTNENQQQTSSSSSTTQTINNNNNTTSTRHRHGSGKDELQPGIVTIIDTVKLFGVRINFFRFYYYLFSSTVIYS
jgi:hypothetical protein